MKGSARQKLDQLNFMEQVRECRDNGYLLSSRKIGSGAFSKVYLAYATHERLRHNPKLASDLRGKRHAMVRQAHLPGGGPQQALWPCPPPTEAPPCRSGSSWHGIPSRLPQAGHSQFQNPLSLSEPGREGRISIAPGAHCFPASVKLSNVRQGHGAVHVPLQGLCLAHKGRPPSLQVAIKIISTAEAPVEFSQKFLPREISSLNATYKHLNVVGGDPKQPIPILCISC